MAQTTANALHGSGYRLVLTATIIAMFVVGFNTTAILTALPAIKSSLELDGQTLQWVINIYMLACAVLIAVMGRFADIFGAMRMFLIGLGIFAVGSVAGLFALDAVMILIGRACQGIGAAAIASISAALISVATPEEKRAQALGLWAGTIAFAFGVGPLIGGVLTDSISWRAIFAIDIVLLAIAALLNLRIEKLKLIPDDLKPGTKIDYLGVGLLIVCLGTFVYGLTSGHQAGWTSLQTLALFAAAVVAGGTFAFHEHRVAEPLIDFSFFRNPRYLASAIGMFFAAYLLMGVIYAYNLFVQAPGALDLTPIEAGLSLLPFTMTMFALSLTAPRLLAPYSFRWPITIGMLVLVAGFWLMHFTSDQTPYSDLWWKLVILGAGIGLAYSLLPRLGLHALPDQSAGQGSGVINTCLYLGASVGIAASGVVAATIRHNAAASAVEKLASTPP
jgi:EmrB/QacA subfamily drug resistance transporter